MKEQHSTRTPGSLSLWSLSSSFAQKQNESQQKEKRSFLWSSSLYTKLAVYSLAVTSTAIFRFPEAVYKHGGALIVAYIILMLIVIQPLVYLELLLGQLYIRKLPVRSAHSIFKVCARGLSVTTAVLILFFIPNHSIVNLQSSSFIDIGSSSSLSNFEWCSCEFLGQPNQNNNEKHGNKYLAYYNSSNLHCLDQNDYSKLEEMKILNQNPVFALDGNAHGQFSTVLYFKQEILNRRSKEIHHKGLTDSPDYILNYIQWKLILSGFFSTAFIVLFSCEWKFQNVLSKILLWMTISFPVTLVGLLLFQLDVSGRVYLVVRLMSFNWRQFGDIKLWFEAVRLAILTSSVGLGLHTSISSSVRMSYRKFYQISWMFIVFVLATVLISTVLLFSEIEILTMLSGTQNPKSTVDTIPNYSISIFASIFCKREFGGLKILYWIFYFLRIVATTRIQVLAVDTILRTLSINDITMQGRKLLRFFLRLAFIGLMQFGMAIPYMLKGSEKLLYNFYLFSGAWPVSILLLSQALYFSKLGSVTMLEEDLYLSYRIKFSKIFAFELKTFFTFTGILVLVLILTCEMIANLVDFGTGKVKLVLCDWPILYGITLNILPFFIFLACLLYEVGIKSNNRRRQKHQKHKNTESCSLLLNLDAGFPSSSTLNRRNRPDKYKKEKEKPYYPWQEEMKRESFNSFYMNQDTHSQVTRATVESSRLRRPSIDNLGNSIPEKSSNLVNLDPARKSSVPLCDCPEASKGNKGCPHTIMDYPDGTEEFPYVSTFREWKDGRYRKRHRVIRPIRRRRAPLPPIWSPGGLGDFSLYGAHIKGRPPGPDAESCLVSTVPVITTNVATQAELISSPDNNNNKNKNENSIIVEIPPPPPPPPLPLPLEYSNVENVESSMSFPPPPKFLLELGIGEGITQDYKMDSIDDRDIMLKTNTQENLKNEEQEQVQEIFTVIEELEQVLGNNKKTTNDSDSPSDNNHGDNIDINMEMDVNFSDEKQYTDIKSDTFNITDESKDTFQQSENENEDESETPSNSLFFAGTNQL